MKRLARLLRRLRIWNRKRLVDKARKEYQISNLTDDRELEKSIF